MTPGNLLKIIWNVKKLQGSDSASAEEAAKITLQA